MLCCLPIAYPDHKAKNLREFLAFQMAAVAALCVQYESDFRPNMTIVVKALQPLVNRAAAAAAAATAGGS
jgi:hypothetical protein